MDRNDLAKLIASGATTFNAWRASNPQEAINLSGFDFSYEFGNCPSLDGIDLSGAMLEGISACGPDRDWPGETTSTFERASFRGAILRGCWFFRTSLARADLSGADLRKAHFQGMSLNRANLENALLDGAVLERVNLMGASLNGASFVGATLKDCSIHGIAAWNVKTDNDTKMEDLRVTRLEEAQLDVDTLDLAQFVYVLTHNPSVRKVLDTVTAKVVLILGRFSERERKEALDALRDLLRQRGYVPILFDFERSASRDLTETISLLAHMARFVVADLTDAKSLPQELQAIVPNLPSVPVRPIILKGQQPYAMFEHFRRFPWVLAPFEYVDYRHLRTAIEDSIIAPAEVLLKSLRNDRVA
jgi:uncharacterized protein YjbI with pentapeptide repeats